MVLKPIVGFWVRISHTDATLKYYCRIGIVFLECTYLSDLDEQHNSNSWYSTKYRKRSNYLQVILYIYIEYIYRNIIIIKKVYISQPVPRCQKNSARVCTVNILYIIIDNGSRSRRRINIFRSLPMKCARAPIIAVLCRRFELIAWITTNVTFATAA